MLNNEIFPLLNNVFQLMIDNKIRKDIDDTLLEKLLGFIKKGKIASGKSEDAFEDLFKQTKALQLIEKALTSLQEQNKHLSGHLQGFAIRLLGIVLEEEVVFLSYKNSTCLQSLSAVCNNSISFSPSIQDAILSSLLCIAKHIEGGKWCVQQNVVEFIFSSFTSTSYYVKKSAIAYFAVTLPVWDVKKVLLSSSERDFVEDSIHRILSRLVTGIQFDNNLPKSSICECSIEALKQILKASNLQSILCNKLNLIGKIKNYFDNVLRESPHNEKLISLLLSLLEVKSDVEYDVICIVKSLMQQGCFVLSLSLASEILRLSDRHKPIHSHHLELNLVPLNILTQSISSELEHAVFHISPSFVHKKIMDQIQSRTMLVAIISSAFESLSKLIDFMDFEALQSTILCLNIFNKNIQEEVLRPVPCAVLLENRLVQLSYLQMFTSFLSQKVYSSLSCDLINMLLNYLLYFLRRPSSDSNILSQVLSHLKEMVSLNAKNNVQLPEETKEIFAELLRRKLLDNKEAVADSALQLAGEIISGTGSLNWKENVFKLGIHLIIWDLAVEGYHDGTVKSSALNAMTKACLQQWCYENISSVKQVTEVDIANILYNFTSDPDFFVQREALCCLFQWVKTKWDNASSTTKFKLFAALESAVKSLDLEMKLTSLNAWQWFIENETHLPRISSSNDVKFYLEFLCDSGFGSSVIIAVQDYDKSVQFKAADIIFNIRKKFLNLGLTENFIPLEKPLQKGIENGVEMNQQPNTEPISEADKDAAIDNVLSLSTAQQISNISRTPNIPKSNYKNCDAANADEFSYLSCSKSAVWDCIWSKKVDSILDVNEIVVANINYALSLLGDILASEVDISQPMDIPDCY